jgi:hypothetical protein
MLLKKSQQEAVELEFDPWRAAQAGHRGRPIHGFDLFGASSGSTVADLEDLPSHAARLTRPQNGSAAGR